MGARIPTKNPRPEEYDFEWPEPDESSWVRLTMEWRKTDGGIVDAELLRPRNWVASSHLEIGSIFKVFSTELELNGIAEITAISPCPPLSTGDGEVVTGRLVTRKADETGRMTFETGDTLEGSKSHPIWSPAIQDWVPMEEWAAGDAVLGREGWITVTFVEVLNESVPLYNIELRGEHVYEVTQAEILVHNSGGGLGGCGINLGNSDVPKNGTIAPNSVNYSQNSVNKSVLDYAKDMEARNWNWDKSGPIRVMLIGGKLVSYDNRRVFAARIAGLKKIPYEKVNPNDLFPGSKRTWGEQFERRRMDVRNLVDGQPLPPTGTNANPKII
ncbi:hypothetical protein [Schlesneria paludicola]|uniref:hypothetical protein n=1 Tax=Schlesneria paludicola TaxID=360056 RepID=UPI00029A0DD6|nr:hypothetical protein [Schlesneria paludicola]